MTWARKRAVDVHDETAGYFSAEYSSDNVYNSPFRYGRSLIDAQWRKVVEGLPAGANCLDIGSGIGAYMARLVEAGFNVRGIEPSAEMRKLARERVPDELVSDGSVTDLPVGDQSQDFIYAIEVFRYLDAADNALRASRDLSGVEAWRGVFRHLCEQVGAWTAIGNSWRYRDCATGCLRQCRAIMSSSRPSRRFGRSLQPRVSKISRSGARCSLPLRPMHKALAEARHSLFKMDAAARELAVRRCRLASIRGSSYHCDCTARSLTGALPPWILNSGHALIKAAKCGRRARDGEILYDPAACPQSFGLLLRQRRTFLFYGLRERIHVSRIDDTSCVSDNTPRIAHISGDRH